MSADLAIAATALSKRYGPVTAVEGLDLAVRRGEIYGFLGLNGAGKTTTIRMLLGLVRPTRGSAEVLGQAVLPGRSGHLGRIGCLIESATAYPNLSVRENLEVQRRLTGAPASAVVDAIDRLRLGPYRDRSAAALSLGNKQRLALARALLHHPDLLVLDEPANALDPAGIVEIRELLRHLSREEGTTVFLSSHILGEVAQLADRIGVIHQGRLVEELDRPAIDGEAQPQLDVLTPSPDAAARALVQAGFQDPERRAGSLRLAAEHRAAPAVARALLAASVAFTGIVPVAADLESHFLQLTGGGA